MSPESRQLLTTTFVLLTLFQFKHFVADYPLQFPYMLRKFRSGWEFVMPLTAHCLVHAALTLVIVLCFDVKLWWLALFDFVAHFVMDRLKSGPRYLGRFKDSTSVSYWTAFGFDQMIHHFTSLVIVWVMVAKPF